MPVLPETSSIRSLFLAGPAGRLEALLNAGSPTATHAAVVCHPHPLYGGTLHNKVVFHAMKALNSFGFPVLRFNFRGTGLSEGEHANGIGEVDDVRAALDWLEREFTLPVIFAGFSFGAAVGLRAAYADDRVRALIALGLPAVPVADRIEDRIYDFEFLRECTQAQTLRQRIARSVRSPRQTRSAGQHLRRPQETGPHRSRRSLLRRKTQGDARGHRRVGPQDPARRSHQRLTTEPRFFL